MSFPIAEVLVTIDNGRALVNRRLVGDGAAPFASAIALTPYLLAMQGVMLDSARAPVGVDALSVLQPKPQPFHARLHVAHEILGKLDQHSA